MIFAQITGEPSSEKCIYADILSHRAEQVSKLLDSRYFHYPDVRLGGIKVSGLNRAELSNNIKVGSGIALTVLYSTQQSDKTPRSMSP